MNCTHKNKAKRLRFFSNAEYKSPDKRAPKWTFHIEQICMDCGKHQAFLKQDRALIEKIDGHLLIENFLDGRFESLQDFQTQQGNGDKKTP